MVQIDEYIVIPIIDGGEVVIPRKRFGGLDSKLEGGHMNYSVVVCTDDGHPYHAFAISREAYMKFRRDLCGIDEDDSTI